MEAGGQREILSVFRKGGYSHMITFLLGLLALIIAVMNGTGKGGRIPLWVAVALLALAMMIPWLVSISVL
jgi:hypothetical protein